MRYKYIKRHEEITKDAQIRLSDEWVNYYDDTHPFTKCEINCVFGDYELRRPLKSGKRSQQQPTAKVRRKPKLPKR